MRFSGLSSLASFVKVAIYLAFGVALLAILSCFGGFIYTMANADDLSRVTTTNMYELPMLAEKLAGERWEADGGEVAFRLHKLYGDFSYLNMPRKMILAIYLRIFGLVLLFFIGVVQMANIFEDVSRGKPFVKENARRLRIIGFAMAGGVIFKFCCQAAIFTLFWGEIAMEGATMPWLFMLRETLSPGLLFGGLIVLVISEVFRLGNRLQEEQELTV